MGVSSQMTVGYERMKPRLVNVVSTCHLVTDKLDLKMLNEQIENSTYNPKKFIALVLKIKDPKATVLLFPNGKIVISGATSQSTSVDVAFQCTKILNSFGCNVIGIKDFTITNMVATFDVLSISKKESNTVINLEKLNDIYLPNKFYDIEIFPALKCTLYDVTLIIFHTGKINFCGAKNIDQINNACNLIKQILIENSIITLMD